MGGGEEFLELRWFKHPRWRCVQKEWTFKGFVQELLEVWVQDARTGLKIHIKKTKSLKLGISADEKVTLGNTKIDLVDSLLTLVVLLVKTMGAVKMLKVN